jgi:hypothetical protein
MRASSFLGGICFLAKTLYHKGVGVLNFHLSLQNGENQEEESMKTKYLKRIVAFVIVLSMVFTTVAMAIPFGQAKKMLKNGYSWDYVQKFVKRKGIMKGYPDGKFYENQYVKRADAIVMIDRAFKLSALIDILNRDYKDMFDDVDINEYFYEAIYIAKLLGITKGRGNNKFFPKQSITVEEVLLLIERAMDKNKYFEFDEDIDLWEDYKNLLGKNKNLKDYATRGDIATLLYYVLTGGQYDEESEYDIDDIQLTIEEGEVLRFDDEYDKKDSLVETIEDEVDDLVYVQFTKPSDKNNNFLYYDYDSSSRSNSFVTNKNKYYVDPERKQLDLSKVTIVPKKAGALEIEYLAYDDEGDSYKGLIKITVEEKRGELEDITFTGYENAPISFSISKFKEVFKKEFDYSSNDKISFKLPDKKYGALYFDEDNDGELERNEKIEKDDIFKLKQMNLVYFYPAPDQVDDEKTIEIEYTVEDGDGNIYEGKIKILVKSLLDTLTLEEDDDFGQEVQEYLDEFEGYDFVTILFEKVDKDSDSDLRAGTRSVLGTEISIRRLVSVEFVPGRNFDGTTFKYTVKTNDGLQFIGLIKVEAGN